MPDRQNGCEHKNGLFCELKNPKWVCPEGEKNSKYA